MRTVEELESACAQLRETANKLWSRARLLELAVRGMYQKTTEDLKGWAITEAEIEPVCELAGEVERLAGEVFGFAEDSVRQPRIIADKSYPKEILPIHIGSGRDCSGNGRVESSACSGGRFPEEASEVSRVE